MSKLKIMQYSLTCCEGCAVNLINALASMLQILDKVEIVTSRILGLPTLREADVAFIDGSVITKEDEEVVKIIRRKSKIVVALGSCASIGGINALKELFSHEEAIRDVYGVFPNIPHLKDVKTLGDVIEVDYILPGCPPTTNEISRFLMDMVLGKTFRLPDKPICYECKIRGIKCLLEEGILCLGPIIRAGCEAKCPAYRVPCWGCKGLTDDVNLEAFLESLERNDIPIKELKEKIPIFLTKSRIKLTSG